MGFENADGGTGVGRGSLEKKKGSIYTNKMASNPAAVCPCTKQADPSLGPDAQMAFWNRGQRPAGRLSRGVGGGGLRRRGWAEGEALGSPQSCPGPWSASSCVRPPGRWACRANGRLWRPGLQAWAQGAGGAVARPLAAQHLPAELVGELLHLLDLARLAAVAQRRAIFCSHLLAVALLWMPQRCASASLCFDEN